MTATAALNRADNPAGFDEFWRATLDSVADVPLDVSVQPLPERSAVDVEVFDIRFTSWERIRIACWYCRPRGSTGPLPAIVQLPGYVGEPVLPKSTARRGYAVLSVAPRGKLRSNAQFNPGYPGLLTHNIVDRQTYGYRGLYVDVLRALDVLLELPEIDLNRIGVAGNSQGGALTLLTAAMRPEIRAASAGAPFLCGIMDAIRLTNSHPYREIKDYLRMYPEREPQVRRTVAYFDLINFADKITCPIIVNIGLADDVCPPETGCALFDVIGSSEKRLYEYADCMHDAGGAMHAPIVASFLDEHLAPVQ